MTLLQTGFLMNSIGNMQVRMISSDFAFVPNYDTNNLLTEADSKDETRSAEILLAKDSLTENREQSKSLIGEGSRKRPVCRLLNNNGLFLYLSLPVV